jgi:cytochrome P450
LTEAALVMATLAQKFRFVEPAGKNVVPEPLITLRAHSGVRMTLAKRS